MTISREIPWYREPWPWILVSGPAIVVVAGIATAVIAWRTNDPLVADDYYKQGLAINREISKDEAAKRLGITARISFSADRTQVRVRLGGAPVSGRGLRMKLVHPTRDGMDQAVSLALIAGDMYEGRLRAPVGETWQIQLLDAESVWRLAGIWKNSSDSVALGGHAAD